MDYNRRELIISRILSGTVRLFFCHASRDFNLDIRKPSAVDIYRANELYFEVKQDAEFEGLYTENDITALMYEYDIWNDELQHQLEMYQRDVEDFKVKLFQFAFKERERNTLRRALCHARENLENLHNKKNQFYYVTSDGMAGLVKSRYILGMSLYNRDGGVFYKDEEEFWKDESSFLEMATSAYINMKLTEGEYRSVARNEPWRSLWDTGQTSNSFFETFPVNYTEEQKEIILWSNLYNSVYEHPECPSDTIVSDDDMLDGWLIEQKREYDKKRNQKEVMSRVSSKVAQAQEVFIPAANIKEAQKIESMNDAAAQGIKRRRENYLKKKGAVHELHMPDVSKKLQMEFNKRLTESFRGGK